MYTSARAKNPKRSSGKTRSWTATTSVYLNWNRRSENKLRKQQREASYNNYLDTHRREACVKLLDSDSRAVCVITGIKCYSAQGEPYLVSGTFPLTDGPEANISECFEKVYDNSGRTA